MSSPRSLSIGQSSSLNIDGASLVIVAAVDAMALEGLWHQEKRHLPTRDRPR